MYTAGVPMANLQAYGMKSYGEFLGVDGVDSTRVHNACTLLEDHKFAPMDSAVSLVSVSYDLPDKTCINDLNMRKATQTTCTHLLDLITEVDACLSITDVIKNEIE